MLLYVFLSVFAIASGGYVTLDDKLEYSDSKVEELRRHVYCYVDKGPCDDLSQSYKTFIEEAIREACAKCNDGQRNAAYTFQIAAGRYFPEEYEMYKRKYDPQRKYFKTFLAAIQPKT